MRRAIFPGSFDPFTIGHADIVRRALPLFDEIVIAVGINYNKQSLFSLEERIKMIEKAFANEKKVRVQTYSGLTVDFAKQIEARYLLRGVRSTIDFEYEKTMADANRELSHGQLETVLLYASPQYAHVSSTLVRDLHSHQHDITPYIP